MSLEERKAIVRWGLRELWNEGNLDVIDEAVAADAVIHDSIDGDLYGADELKDLIATYRAAFPDVRVTIHDQVAEGDLVVTRYTATGTQAGALGTSPPTGRNVTIAGVSIARFDGAKIVEVWESWDGLTLVQQLGLARRWRGVRRGIGAVR